MRALMTTIGAPRVGACEVGDGHRAASTSGCRGRGLDHDRLARAEAVREVVVGRLDRHAVLVARHHAVAQRRAGRPVTEVVVRPRQQAVRRADRVATGRGCLCWTRERGDQGRAERDERWCLPHRGGMLSGDRGAPPRLAQLELLAHAKHGVLVDARANRSSHAIPTRSSPSDATISAALAAPTADARGHDDRRRERHQRADHRDARLGIVDGRERQQVATTSARVSTVSRTAGPPGRETIAPPIAYSDAHST